jgi:hypothetical protein
VAGEMKAYLYCTKAKPYLIDDMDVFPEQRKEEHYTLEDDKHYDGIGLNGFVFFECEINKVEEIRHDYSPLGDDLFFTKSVSIPVDFERQTCLNTEQLNSYQPRYALYLENVKKIDKPFPISQAPQNMCYMTMNGERCVLISIQPQHLANIANGLKDIEVRKSILNELKEIIK